MENTRSHGLPSASHHRILQVVFHSFRMPCADAFPPMLSRKQSMMLALAAAILGGYMAYVLLSPKADPSNGDASEEPEAFVTVDAAPPPKDAISYADFTGLPSFDWPRLFGPDGNSIISYPAELAGWPAEGPPVVWRMPVGQGYSAPVVQGNRLIIAHRLEDEERIECRDAATGDLLWDFRYPTAYESPVRYSNGPYSTPAIVGDRVYAIGAEARLHCLQLDDGLPVWSRDLKSEFELVNTNYGEPEFYGFCPSPLPLGEALIVNVGGREQQAGVVAFDQMTGKTLWQATSDGASYATPVAAEIDGEPVAIVLSRDGLLVLDPDNGHVHFQHEFRAKNPDTTNATSPVVMDDTIFACGYGVGAMAVRLEKSSAGESCSPPGQESFTAEVLWQNRRALDAQYTNLFLLDGLVIGYPSRLKGAISAVEIETGKTRWKLATGYARGGGLFINGELIVLSEEGDLLRFSKLPDEPVLSSIIEGFLQGPCYTGPIFANGRMYLRTEQELVCVRLF